MASPNGAGLFWEVIWLAIAVCAHLQTRAEQSQGAYFLPEFALSPQGSFLEDTTGEQFLTYRYDDQRENDQEEQGNVLKSKHYGHTQAEDDTEKENAF